MKLNIPFTPLGMEEENACAYEPGSAVLLSDVLFGSPRKRCAGNGICKVSVSSPKVVEYKGNLNCKRAIALIQLLDQRKVLFHFVKASMCSRIQKKYFSEELFTITEAAVLDLDTWSDIRYQIAPGKYPYKSTKDYYSMIYDLIPGNEKAHKIGPIEFPVRGKLSADEYG